MIFLPLPAFLDISSGELLVIIIAVFIVFGPKKVPEVARQIGKGMNELKKVTNDLTKDFKDGVSQVKENEDALKPDIYGNRPYVAPNPNENIVPPVADSKPFSNSGYNEIHTKSETIIDESEVKPTEVQPKSEEKGLLF